jgi:hypothetical protein
MLSSATSPTATRRFESLSDPYSPVIVDDLLNGLSDWRNIQDIVRLTFKAMSDVLKAQGAAIRDLERQMPLKSSKAELQSALSQKASLTDLSEQAAELAAMVESRGPLLDLQAQIEQKVSRSDLSYLLGTRPTVEEVKGLLESKASLRDIEEGVQGAIGRLEEQVRDLGKKQANCVQERDFKALETQIQSKAAQVDLETALSEKASKQMVASALSRKVNMSDFETLLSHKADSNQIQSILEVLETKADLNLVEKVIMQVREKAESVDFAAITEEIRSKASKRDLDELQEGLLAELRENKHLLSAQSSTVDEQMSTLSGELDRIRSSFNAALGKKADSKDMDRIISIVGKKAEEERVTDLLRLHKAEVSEMVLSVKSEMRVDRQMSDQRGVERAQTLEKEVKEMVSEVDRLRSTCGEMMESRRREQEDTAKYAKSLNSSLKLEFSGELFALKDRVEAITKICAALSKEKANSSDLMEVKTQFQAGIVSRPSFDHIQGALEELKGDFSAVVTDLRDDCKLKLTRLEGSFFEALKDKANFSEMQSYLSEKADSASVARLCSFKAASDDLESLRQTVDFLKNEITRKAERTELDLHIAHTRNALEEASKDIVLKASIKDVCSLLDQKASKFLSRRGRHQQSFERAA